MGSNFTDFGDLVLVIGDFHIPHRASSLPPCFQELLNTDKIRHVLCTGNLGCKKVLDQLRGLAGSVHIVRGDMDTTALGGRSGSCSSGSSSSASGVSSFATPGRGGAVGGKSAGQSGSVSSFSRNAAGSSGGGGREGAGDASADGLASLPEYKVVQIGDFKVGIIHGHQIIPWGDTESLTVWLRRLGCDILVTGHTHRHSITEVEDGKFLVNPGSATGAYQAFNDRAFLSGIKADKQESRQEEDASPPAPSFMLMAVQGCTIVVYVYEEKDGKANVVMSEFTKSKATLTSPSCGFGAGLNGSAAGGGGGQTAPVGVATAGIQQNQHQHEGQAERREYAREQAATPAPPSATMQESVCRDKTSSLYSPPSPRSPSSAGKRQSSSPSSSSPDDQLLAESSSRPPQQDHDSPLRTNAADADHSASSPSHLKRTDDGAKDSFDEYLF